MQNRTSVLFIVNPISGTTDKKRIVALIPKYLSDERFDVHVAYTDHSGHAAELASEAVADGTDVVVAVGGDGTVNEVARSLVHSRTALGIIPCGSGNGLARHLYIPMNPEGAMQVLADCQIKSLDYGIINGTPFFCTCGVGFDAFVSSKFAKSGRRGLLTYIENTLKEGLKYQPDTYEMEIDGEKKQFKAFLIACANASQYGNDALIDGCDCDGAVQCARSTTDSYPALQQDHYAEQQDTLLQVSAPEDIPQESRCDSLRWRSQGGRMRDRRARDAKRHPHRGEHQRATLSASTPEYIQ